MTKYTVRYWTLQYEVPVEADTELEARRIGDSDPGASILWDTYADDGELLITVRGGWPEDYEEEVL